MKRNFSTAFPTLSAAASLVNLGYNAYKRYKSGSYTVNPSNEAKMPFSAKRRRVSGRSTSMVRRRRSKYGGLRRKLYRFRRTVRRKGLLAIETKYFEGSFTDIRPVPWDNADPTLSPQRLSHFTAIAGGSGQSARVGGKIWVRKLRVKFFANAFPASPARNEQYIRIYIIRDLAPLQEDVSSAGSTRIGYYLQSTGVNENLNLQPYNYINTFRTPRPQILYTKLIKVSRETGSDYQYKTWKKTINIYKPTHYAGPSSNANAGMGQIYMFAYTNELDPASAPYLSWSWRLMYTDA